MLNSTSRQALPENLVCGPHRTHRGREVERRGVTCLKRHSQVEAMWSKRESTSELETWILKSSDTPSTSDLSNCCSHQLCY